MVLDQLREQGPVLLVDAGNALFKAPLVGDAVEKKKAQFLLSTMGQLHTVAMPAGVRDLSAGLEFLRKTAASAGVRVLSVNLKEHGKTVFPPSMIVSVGGVRVGVFGASAPGKFPGEEGVEGAPVIEPAVREARKLKKKTDLVIGLCAMPYADVLELSREAKESVDLILYSHEARGAGIAQRQDHNYVIPTGERGRQLGELLLDLSSKGPLVDLSEIERSRQVMQRLDQQIAETRKRIDATADGSTKAALQKTLASFQERRKTMEKTPTDASGRKTLSLSFADLGPQVADDPALSAEVAKYEPPQNAAGH